MIRVSELRLELDEDESLLRKKAGKVLRTDPKYIEKLTIFKKSVDARKKDDVHFSYTVDVTLGLTKPRCCAAAAHLRPRRRKNTSTPCR